MHCSSRQSQQPGMPRSNIRISGLPKAARCTEFCLPELSLRSRLISSRESNVELACHVSRLASDSSP